MLTYPSIDPIVIQLGPLAIRWYSLAYIAGILLGWWVVMREHARKPIQGLTAKTLDDMVMWAVIGIILGGRLGYVLFYKPDYYLDHPEEILALWHGGMSFHGGFAGVILVFFWFCRKHQIRFLELMDVFAAAAPIGLFFGRVANFINGELYGRTTDMPWGMIFPHGGLLPRHPSQLYEAGLEGIVLFAITFGLMKFTRARDKIGLLSGVFLLGYGLSRVIVECVREPDDFLGFFWGSITMGQILCLPMLLGGLYLITRRSRQP
ncbi:MAG: prolipoprotein diacylglyceryl transferase [Rickettsiales bacterium]|nr:prolipoprotein diacylglyceryl transferase [Rickettsiales bacterium]